MGQGDRRGGQRQPAGDRRRQARPAPRGVGRRAQGAARAAAQVVGEQVDARRLALGPRAGADPGAGGGVRGEEAAGEQEQARAHGGQGVRQGQERAGHGHAQRADRHRRAADAVGQPARERRAQAARRVRQEHQGGEPRGQGQGRCGQAERDRVEQGDERGRAQQAHRVQAQQHRVRDRRLEARAHVGAGGGGAAGRAVREEQGHQDRAQHAERADQGQRGAPAEPVDADARDEPADHAARAVARHQRADRRSDAERADLLGQERHRGGGDARGRQSLQDAQEQERRVVRGQWEQEPDDGGDGQRPDDDPPAAEALGQGRERHHGQRERARGRADRERRAARGEAELGRQLRQHGLRRVQQGEGREPGRGGGRGQPGHGVDGKQCVQCAVRGEFMR
ncbi:Transcription termination factor Rho [Actinosynnema pretiosum subsp. pretiosum]|nr:Transcription termination factor Rho [Actinosynnema pretiosum subsp. pretiosum]